MSDDLCKCGHWMIDHSEIGCENCMCNDFTWPAAALRDTGGE